MILLIYRRYKKKQHTKKQKGKTHRYRKQNSSYQRGKGQIYGDGRRLDFGSWVHNRVYRYHTGIN